MSRITPGVVYVVRAPERAHLTDPWIREWPECKPRERTRERIDDGFVLVGGWQTCYSPTPERRAEVTGKAWAARLANEAADRKAQRRADAERKQ